MAYDRSRIRGAEVVQENAIKSAAGGRFGIEKLGGSSTKGRRRNKSGSGEEKGSIHRR